MADQTKSLKSKIMGINNIYLYLLGLYHLSQHYYFFTLVIWLLKMKKSRRESWYLQSCQRRSNKLGRLEPDEKPIVQEIGADGKVIIPTLSYVDIGGMGDNANKSFWTNIPNSNSFISFDLVLSSYKGEKLTDYLTDYDVDLRKIVYDEISKNNFSDFDGSKGKKKLLENIKNEFNSYFDSKKLDPVVFGAYFKAFAITTRG